SCRREIDKLCDEIMHLTRRQARMGNFCKHPSTLPGDKHLCQSETQSGDLVILNLSTKTLILQPL
ncbi:MAG: hypothetical protein PHY86_03745, partial [Candidatus Gracilibacteria bacterium]|nr:hypothetical protein [Candidatus Gracilibacteria bacterium]